MKEYQKPSLKITGLTPEERLACSSGWDGCSGSSGYSGFSSWEAFWEWVKKYWG